MAEAQLIQARKQKNMDCDASVDVGDLVYLHDSTPNKVITASDNNSPRPVIGLVIAKPTSTKARILIDGIIKIDGVIPIGKMFVSTSGGITLTPTITNYLQDLGNSFGDGIIDFTPVTRRVKRS